MELQPVKRARWTTWWPNGESAHSVDRTIADPPSTCLHPRELRIDDAKRPNPIGPGEVNTSIDRPPLQRFTPSGIGEKCLPVIGADMKCDYRARALQSDEPPDPHQ